MLVGAAHARHARLVLPELRVEPKVVYEDALYHASAEQMLEMLRDSAGANRVMLVGHNPEIHPSRSISWARVRSISGIG